MALTQKYIRSAEINNIETVLDERLRTAKKGLSPSMSTLPLTLSFKVEKVNILNWLKCQERFPRVYWTSRNGDLEIGGCGKALMVVAPEVVEVDQKLREIEKTLRSSEIDPQLRFIGGRCFDETLKEDPLWSDFPPLWFIVPKLSIARNEGNCLLTVATKVTIDTTKTGLLEDFNETLDGVTLDSPPLEEPVPEILSRRDHPDLVGWTDNVSRSLREINRQSMEKIVLARRTDMTFSGNANPFTLLSRLKKKNKNCFAFLLEPRSGKAFVGVTPERLFKIEGENIISEAISGTTARGDIHRESYRAENGSLFTAKNLLEHQYVLDDITKRIETLCEAINPTEERSTFELSNISHIYSRISGRLMHDVSLSEIISSLHPTPAVGGTPRESVLPLVRELEPFSRGWYASPVGIIGQDYTEMAVAIRSAIVEDDRAFLFAGAGIVSGSVPNAEWQELEQKISHAIEGLSGVLL